MNSGLLWGIIALVVGVVLLVCLVVFLVLRTKKAMGDKSQMEADLPVIRQNEQAAQYALYQNGIVCSAHYSNLGYKFIEYRTKYNAPDNVHFIIDEVNKKFVAYMLLPYSFKVYSFSDYEKCELTVNNGMLETSTVGTGAGTSLGGIGVGVGVANSTSSQQVTSITVSVTFKNGDVAYVNFLDNIMAYQGDNRYNVALASAKQFRDKLELLHKYAA